jgi:hypothetical protein
MTAVIQESTATMTADYAGAKPGVSYTLRRGPHGSTDMAVLHQTRNSRSIVAGAIRSQVQAHAIKITARVNVIAERLSDIQSRYSFHLLQLVWKPVDYALYAGKTRADGSMKLDFVAPPFYPTGSPFLLDADETGANPFPYAECIEPGHAIKIEQLPPSPVWTVSLEFYDHPSADRPLTLPNFATPSFNYLYEAGRSLYFTTSLVVRDLNGGDRKPLGFLAWKSVLRAQIPWQNGNPLPAVPITSYLTSDDFAHNAVAVHLPLSGREVTGREP